MATTTIKTIDDIYQIKMAKQNATLPLTRKHYWEQQPDPPVLSE